MVSLTIISLLILKKTKREEIGTEINLLKENNSLTMSSMPSLRGRDMIKGFCLFSEV